MTREYGAVKNGANRRVHIPRNSPAEMYREPQAGAIADVCKRERRTRYGCASNELSTTSVVIETSAANLLVARDADVSI
jgi:hypothetical protein